MTTQYLWRRLLAGLLMTMLLILAACGGAVEATPEATQESQQEQVAAADNETTENPTEEPTAVAVQPEPDQEDELVSAPIEPASCEAVTIPENVAIPPVTDEDWVKGPADAAVTVIEFGDFQ